VELTQQGEVTELLQAGRAGDGRALDKLIPPVYGELKRLARSYMTGERADHTLQATALVQALGATAKVAPQAHEMISCTLTREGAPETNDEPSTPSDEARRVVDRFERSGSPLARVAGLLANLGNSAEWRPGLPAATRDGTRGPSSACPADV
jgi:hypothetical protein